VCLCYCLCAFAAKHTVSIGRDLGNQVVVPDAGVSRSHARIEWKDNRMCACVCMCVWMDALIRIPFYDFVRI